jgi:hypothetical protein
VGAALTGEPYRLSVDLTHAPVGPEEGAVEIEGDETDHGKATLFVFKLSKRP